MAGFVNKINYKGTEKEISPYVEITYSNLVSLRDSSGLTPGQSYRIIDYNTYVSDIVDNYAQSSNHQFDIIVKADSTNKLNENARAVQHSGDTYFSGSTLSAWEIKYCLDNDTNKFGFALSPHGAGIVVPDFSSDILIETNTTIETDNGTYYVFGTQEQAQEYYGEGDVYFCCDSNSPEVEESCCIAYYDEDEGMYIIDESYVITKVVSSSSSNGKGVIYWMKDEWDNECPYDFKNIQFKRYKVTATTKSNLSSLVNTYISVDSSSMSNFTVDSSQSVWRYTFDYNTMDGNSSAEDASLLGKENNVYKNNIQDYRPSRALMLNNIIFYGQYNFGNVFKVDCYNNTFGNYCQSNTFGNGCGSNTFGNYSQSNTFGNECYYNTFGNNCNNNTFGNYFRGNTFGNSCNYNTFGNSCNNNTFGNYFRGNTFGNSCNNNTFGNECYNNTFGNSCGSNTFGNYCQSNTFGNSCNNNTFGNECNNNTFGNYFRRNTFGNNCYSNTFGNSCNNNTFGNYSQSNTFGNSCQYITFSKDYSYYNIVENGNQYITLTSSESTSSSNVLRNITISQGVNNTTTTKTISHNSVNDAFKTTYQPQNSQVISV